MKFEILHHLNYTAILVAALAYFFVGFLWFGLLFGKPWSKELEKVGMTFTKPTTGQMVMMMLRSFFFNLVTAITVAYVMHTFGFQTFDTALKVGLALGVGLAGATVGMDHTWKKGSFLLLVLDGSHVIVGVTVCTLIISLWK